MKSAENLFLLDTSVVDIKSLNTPLLGKAAASSTKELEGVLWKKGEVVKSWKQRYRCRPRRQRKAKSKETK